MALVKGCLWAKETFEVGSRPGREKIVRWIENGEIKGEVIDGEPYVDADYFAIHGRYRPEPPPGLTGADLLN